MIGKKTHHLLHCVIAQDNLQDCVYLQGAPSWPRYRREETRRVCWPEPAQSPRKRVTTNPVASWWLHLHSVCLCLNVASPGTWESLVMTRPMISQWQEWGHSWSWNYLSPWSFAELKQISSWKAYASSSLQKQRWGKCWGSTHLVATAL